MRAFYAGIQTTFFSCSHMTVSEDQKPSAPKFHCQCCGQLLSEIHGSMVCTNSSCQLKGMKQVACCEGGDCDL